MSPSRIFILRPVATTLLMAAILLAGFVAYRQLPVSALPQVDYPTIQVLTFYPGAGPSVIVSSVTAPLERQFGQVPGLKQMTSTSTFGGVADHSAVRSQSEHRRRRAAGAGGDQCRRHLPAHRPAEPADLQQSESGRRADSDSGADFARPCRCTRSRIWPTPRWRQKISQLPGVGLVTISGGQKPAVRVQANPTALASYGLSLEDMRTALAAANVDQAKGNIDGPRQAFTIGANDQIFHERRIQAGHRRLQEWRAGARRRTSPTSSMASRTPIRPPGTTKPPR